MKKSHFDSFFFDSIRLAESELISTFEIREGEKLSVPILESLDSGKGGLAFIIHRSMLRWFGFASFRDWAVISRAKRLN